MSQKPRQEVVDMKVVVQSKFGPVILSLARHKVSTLSRHGARASEFSHPSFAFVFRRRDEQGATRSR